MNGQRRGPGRRGLGMKGRPSERELKGEEESHLLYDLDLLGVATPEDDGVAPE